MNLDNRAHLITAAAAPIEAIGVKGIRQRAIAAALLSLGNNIQRDRRGLLSAHKVSIRISSFCLRLPAIQGHRITASGEFGAITVGNGHSTSIYIHTILDFSEAIRLYYTFKTAHRAHWARRWFRKTCV